MSISGWGTPDVVSPDALKLPPSLTDIPIVHALARPLPSRSQTAPPLLFPQLSVLADHRCLPFRHVHNQTLVLHAVHRSRALRMILLQAFTCPPVRPRICSRRGRGSEGESRRGGRSGHGGARPAGGGERQVVDRRRSRNAPRPTRSRCRRRIHRQIAPQSIHVHRPCPVPPFWFPRPGWLARLRCPGHSTGRTGCRGLF